MSTHVGILVFDEVDLLDVGGPYEVFLTAGRLVVRDGAPSPFSVTTIGVTRRPVTSYGGLGLVPTHTVSDVPDLDVVVIPGAISIDNVIRHEPTMAAVRSLCGSASIAASVCTGSFLLGEAGLLEARAWTTHWEDVADLAARIGTEHATTAQWVDTGEVVTAGGLSSGMAMALHMVDRIEGRELAVRTARQMDYAWDADGGVS
jgi:transcriptional regulator GlxA family with amidase domain